MAKRVHQGLYLIIAGMVSATLFIGLNGTQSEQINCEITCKSNTIGLTILTVLVLVTIVISSRKNGSLPSSIEVPSAKRLLHRIIVINVLVILLLDSLFPFYMQLKDMRVNARKFLFESTSTMKQRVYGNCNKMGYGYLEEMISFIPEPDIFPTMRYSDFNRFPHVLFSDTRRQYDERLLVGISLHENETQEMEITKAQLISGETDSLQATLTFQTRDNYDLLTGIIINLDDESESQSQILSVTLYESPIHFVVVGQWDVAIPEGQLSTTYAISDPIQDFSHNRGKTDFILTIESRDHIPLPNIRDITILGIKVDISEYTVYNRVSDNNRFCFAAIKNSFLNEINAKGDAKWQDYLNKVSNIDTNR